MFFEKYERRQKSSFLETIALNPAHSFVRSHTFYLQGTELCVGPDPYRRGSMTGNQTKPDPHPPRGCPSNSLADVFFLSFLALKILNFILFFLHSPSFTLGSRGRNQHIEDERASERTSWWQSRGPFPRFWKRVFLEAPVLILFFPFWWLSYIKLFYLSLKSANFWRLNFLDDPWKAQTVWQTYRIIKHRIIQVLTRCLTWRQSPR